MAAAYEDAVGALYQAGLDSFVAERKRLAAELKSGGDKAGAARLSKLARPPLSAWAVNQLWWQKRGTFEELFASAERIRQGDLGASREHREALAQLRAAASGLLGAGGHAAADATLRRVTITLSALAAAGGFAPDAPGALGADRDPLGFDAVALAAPASAAAGPASHKDPEPGSAEHAEPGAEHRQQERERSDGERRRQEQERLAAERQQQEQQRLDAERTRLDAERRRLEQELAQAESAVERSAQALTRLERELTAARDALASSRSAAAEAKKKLAALAPPRID